MEQPVLFEQKVALTPKDMNRMGTDSINTIILEQISKNLEGRCNQHGYVIQGSLEILSRSMGQLEHGRYTGNVVFHVHLQGKVYNPVNGTRITGKIDKKNKMGLYIIYNDAIRILIPRDLHIGNKAFEMLEPGTEITVEIRKSRFQVQDQFILSIGVLVDQHVEENNMNVAVATPLEGSINEGAMTPPPPLEHNSGNEA
jgi:DNA-directed RNA polymerase subunit E'/Rpb7